MCVCGCVAIDHLILKNLRSCDTINYGNHFIMYKHLIGLKYHAYKSFTIIIIETFLLLTNKQMLSEKKWSIRKISVIHKKW